MIVSGQLALAAGAQRLSNLYGGASAGNAIDPKQDVPYQAILLQAAGADAFVGQDLNVTSSVYGTKVASTDLQPVTLLTTRTGSPLKFSDLWVAGAGATIHVLGIPQ